LESGHKTDYAFRRPGSEFSFFNPRKFGNYLLLFH